MNTVALTPRAIVPLVAVVELCVFCIGLHGSSQVSRFQRIHQSVETRWRFGGY